MSLKREDFAVRKVCSGWGVDEGRKIVVLDTNHATYHNKPWKQLSEFEKRKFENLVVLSEPKERIKVIYE